MPEKIKIFVDVHNEGGRVKANVHARGQGGGGQILLKLCGRHKWMPPNESDWSSDESVTQRQCSRLNTEMTSGCDSRSLLCTTYSCDVSSL